MVVSVLNSIGNIRYQKTGQAAQVLSYCSVYTNDNLYKRESKSDLCRIFEAHLTIWKKVIERSLARYGLSLIQYIKKWIQADLSKTKEIQLMVPWCDGLVCLGYRGLFYTLDQPT